MADWPRYFLERADSVTIESDGHTWKMDGPTFVRCLESGGWTMDERRDERVAARVEGLHTREIHECPICNLVPEDFADGFPNGYNRKLYDHDIARNLQRDPNYQIPYSYEDLVSGRAR